MSTNDRSETRTPETNYENDNSENEWSEADCSGIDCSEADCSETDSSKTLIPKSEPVCHEHNSPFVYWCSHCSQVSCYKCIIEKQDTCRFALIQDSIPNIQSDTQSKARKAIDNIETDVSRLREKDDYFTNCLEKLDVIRDKGNLIEKNYEKFLQRNTGQRKKDLVLANTIIMELNTVKFAEKDEGVLIGMRETLGKIGHRMKLKKDHEASGVYWGLTDLMADVEKEEEFKDSIKAKKAKLDDKEETENPSVTAEEPTVSSKAAA